ncbi:MFS transporter [Limosilactobacillus ingluviei]|uniref:MFS transporter n=1 Tax=Limosilactobacillus ingluviei TaxID=148604 RepID=UPI0024B991E7|nr:MFS transporter [Limosilactobacillus ingluviei]
MSKLVKRTIAIMIVCEFLICLGLSLIFPVMPFIKNEYHFSAFDMGMMSALFALVQFVASPVVGRWSDRLGRKPMLIWGMVLFAIGQLIFAVGNTLWIFDFSRVIDGLSAAMFVPTSMALAADITTPRERAKVIGWLSAAFSGGLILGPGLGGILAAWGYKVPFWVAGILGGMATLVALFWLPDDRKVDLGQPSEPAPTSPAPGWGKYRHLMTRPMLILFAMILVAAFGLAGFESIYSLYVNEVHQFDLAAIATVLTLNGILSLVLQVFFFEKLVVWLGEVKLIRYSYLLSALATLVVIYDHSHWQIIVATLVVFEAFDLLRPAITTLLTKASTKDQGLINGMNMSLTSIGNIFGPLLSGATLDWNYQYPYLIVTVFLMVAFGISFGLRKFMAQN